jgi:hypothetical protein
MLEQLREQAGLGGPAAALANEILVMHDHYTNGLLTKEEYDFLLQDIKDVRAQQDLANDEMACRFICQAAQVLLSM